MQTKHTEPGNNLHVGSGSVSRRPVRVKPTAALSLVQHGFLVVVLEGFVQAADSTASSVRQYKTKIIQAVSQESSVLTIYTIDSICSTAVCVNYLHYRIYYMIRF